MGRVARSFALAKASWHILRTEPGLFAFPVLGSAVSALVAGIFIGAIALTGLAQQTAATTGSTTVVVTVAGWILLVLMYVVLAYVATLFSAALVIGALQRIRGEDPSVGGCLRAALGLTRFLLPWSLFQATVAGIVRSLAQRGGIFGAIAAGFVGAAWEVVTFLAVPIIVTEHVGPIKALKRSATLLKQTWGENLIGQAGLGIVGALLSLPGVVAFVLGAILLGPNVVAGLGLIAVGVLYLVLVTLMMTAMSGVYRAALYEYATTGQQPAAYADLDLASAFRAR